MCIVNVEYLVKKSVNDFFSYVSLHMLLIVSSVDFLAFSAEFLILDPQRKWVVTVLLNPEILVS